MKTYTFRQEVEDNLLAHKIKADKIIESKSSVKIIIVKKNIVGLFEAKEKAPLRSRESIESIIDKIEKFY